MKLSSNISKSVYAWALLLSFGGIILISSICTIDNIVHERQLFTKADDHQDEHHHEDNHHQHVHHSDQNNDDDDCCNDVAVAFFTSVQVPPQQPAVGFTALQFTMLHAVVNSLFSFDYKFELYSDKPPSPNLLPGSPDIRIFIQSFQI